MGLLRALLLVTVLFTSIARADDGVDASEREPAGVGRGTILAPADARILHRGEISKARYVIGGVTGSVIGFGIGHAIQGTYPEIGWAFSSGEGVSLTLIFLAEVSCLGDRAPNANGTTPTCEPPAGLYVPGLVGLIGFHIWEVIDLWTRPLAINERYHELTRTKGHVFEELRVYPTLVQRTPGLGIGATF